MKPVISMAAAISLLTLSIAPVAACTYEKQARTTAEAVPATQPQVQAAAPASPAPVATPSAQPVPAETQTAGTATVVPGQPKAN